MLFLNKTGFWSALCAFIFAPLCIGGGSSSTSAQTYNTTDSRVAGGTAPTAGAGALQSIGGNISTNAVEVKTTSGTVNVQSASAVEFARLLDTLDRQNAIQGQALNNYLHSADGIAQLAAQAQAQASPGLDNKTIMLLAVAGIVLVFIVGKK